MKMTYKYRAEIAALKQILYRKRRGAIYRPQVGAITIAGENSFRVRINNLPMTIEPFVSILKVSEYRITNMGRDLAGGYIVVERVE